MKKKILVILYNITKAQEHEWFVKYIDRQRFEIEFVLINGANGYLHQYLEKENVPVHLFQYSGKTDLPFLVFKLFRLIRSRKYHIVHAHLFEGALAGMTAAWLAGSPQRISTRHYSDFHHVNNPSAVKYDRWINSRSTLIIAISENVKNILIQREGVPESKIRLVYHGIDLSDYATDAAKEERMRALRLKYNLEAMHPVIGVISKFIDWKGLQYILPAFAELISKYPDAVLLLLNAHGPYRDHVNSLLENIPERNYRLIQFENDIPALYKILDCFVHVPINESAEAFGQVYIEALASSVPSVFTLSGIASEFIRDQEHAIVVPYKNSTEILVAINKILSDTRRADEMAERGCAVVKARFDVRKKFIALESIYSG